MLLPVLAFVCCGQMGTLKRNILLLLLQKPFSRFHAPDLVAAAIYETFKVVLVGLHNRGGVCAVGTVGAVGTVILSIDNCNQHQHHN